MKLISLILSIVLSISIIALIFNITLKQNIFDESYHKNIVKKEGLNKEIKDRVEEKLKLVTVESNCPETLYQNIVVDDMIDINVDKIVEENIKAINKQDYNKDVVNVDDLLNAYNQRIDDYIQSRNVEMDDDAIIVINYVKLRAKEEVLAAISSINFWTFLENHENSTILNLFLSTSAFTNIRFVMVSLLIILLTIIGIFILNSNKLTLFFKYIGIALFIGGAVPFSVGLGGNLSNISKSILFMGTAANKLLTALIDSAFSFLTVSGLIVLAIGILAVIVSALTVPRRVRSSLSRTTM